MNNPAQTSIAQRGDPPDWCTVKFLKWQAWGNTGYCRGMYAGFPARQAKKLLEMGAVEINPADVHKLSGVESSFR